MEPLFKRAEAAAPRRLMEDKPGLTVNKTHRLAFKVQVTAERWFGGRMSLKNASEVTVFMAVCHFNRKQKTVN